MTTDLSAEATRLLALATPGEWEPVLPGDPRGQPVSYYSGTVCLVSCDPPLAVVSRLRETEGRHVSPEEWEANTRLIAAAPQLAAEVVRLAGELRLAEQQRDAAVEALRTEREHGESVRALRAQVAALEAAPAKGGDRG
jgi:hypothetical protein